MSEDGSSNAVLDVRTGLVAVVSRDPDMPVRRSEVAGLADTYESLRGTGARTPSPESPLVQAMAIAVAGEEDSGMVGDDAWWMALTGDIRPAPHESRASLADADGHFALIMCDARRNRVLLATDPLGIQALFIAESDERVYVSTSALALAKHLRLAPDPLGVRIFLRMGSHVGSATNWDGLTRLEPGNTVEIGPRCRTQRVIWRPERDPAVARLSFASTVEHVLEVMQTACRTYMAPVEAEHSPWLNLSGGFDSRLLALALDSVGVRFRATTQGPADDAEVRAARAICRLKGWAWRGFDGPDDGIPGSLLEAALAWGDAQLGVLGLGYRFWKHAQTARDARVLVGGGGGELLRDFAWQQELGRAGRSSGVNLRSWIDLRLLGPLDVTVFQKDPTAEVRADLATRFTDWVAPYEGERNSFKLDLMYAYKSTGTFGAHCSADRLFHSRRSPFLYRPMVTAAISTREDHRRRHRLMRHLMARLDARVAAVEAVPWRGPAGPMRIGNAHRFVPYYVDIGRRAVNKLGEQAVGRPVIPRRARGAAPDDPALRSMLAHANASVAGGLRHATMRSAALYRRERLDELIARERHDSRSRALLDRIVTLELALWAADADVAVA